MAIDYLDVFADLYSRAATDPEGSAVRALLGGATSIFPADQLAQVAGVVLPWLVWRAGAVGNTSGEMRDCAASWWIYCALNKGDRPLHRIAAEVENLYGSRSALALAGGRLVVTFVSQPRKDDALGLNGMEIRIAYRRLG